MSHVSDTAAMLYLNLWVRFTTIDEREQADRQETRASRGQCDKHHDHGMHHRSCRIRPLYEVEGYTEPDVDI
jgi:hypothetical protein